MDVIDLSKLKSDERPGTRSDGLRGLANVKLSAANQHMLEVAGAVNGGEPQWQGRKRAEARDVLALSQVAPPGRLRIGWIDMFSDLRMMLFLGVPVARTPDANNELPIANQVVLGLSYSEQAVVRDLPGVAFFDVLDPRDPWHANIGSLPPLPAEIRQVLCLGTEIPAGIRCTDLIVAAYGALSMQNLQIDHRDPAGVLNFEAASWWQQNTHRVPLTKVPFLGEEQQS